MAIADVIRDAVNSLGLQARVRQLNAQEAAKAVAATEGRFISGRNSRWWWERLNDELRIVSHAPDADGYKLVELICPDEPAWLIASDDEDPPWPVFIGMPKDLVRVIGECHHFEYSVASPRLEWLVIENHHSEVIAVGEPAAGKLAQHAG